MNKKYIFWIILAIAVIAGIFVFFLFNRNNTNENGEANYEAGRTSQNVTENRNPDEENQDENDEEADDEDEDEPNDDDNADEKNNNEIEKGVNPEPVETEIASFTTKIYTKESGRQNNVTIACSTLNDTIVENGSTFSFSKTVGRATTAKGYKKADVFRNGDVVEALGGGLCQISTTLYNAVLKVPDLKVTERHPHSNKVPYIKSGKDAAVSYGAQDFKFVNNTGNSIKIKAENSPNNVTIKLIKLE